MVIQMESPSKVALGAGSLMAVAERVVQGLRCEHEEL